MILVARNQHGIVGATNSCVVTNGRNSPGSDLSLIIDVDSILPNEGKTVVANDKSTQVDHRTPVFPKEYSSLALVSRTTDHLPLRVGPICESTAVDVTEVMPRSIPHNRIGDLVVTAQHGISDRYPEIVDHLEVGLDVTPVHGAQVLHALLFRPEEGIIIRISCEVRFADDLALIIDPRWIAASSAQCAEVNHFSVLPKEGILGWDRRSVGTWIRRVRRRACI